jgi:hypothetical protein
MKMKIYEADINLLLLRRAQRVVISFVEELGTLDPLIFAAALS